MSTTVLSELRRYRAGAPFSDPAVDKQYPPDLEIDLKDAFSLSQILSIRPARHSWGDEEYFADQLRRTLCANSPLFLGCTRASGYPSSPTETVVDLSPIIEKGE